MGIHCRQGLSLHLGHGGCFGLLHLKLSSLLLLQVVGWNAPRQLLLLLLLLWIELLRLLLILWLALGSITTTTQGIVDGHGLWG